jgi:hypothetical protein
MDNSSSEENYVDPYPTSGLILGIWFFFLGCFGIPLNIFIAIATLKVKEIRDIFSR